MPTLTVLYGPPTDPESFRAHYLGRHLALARALPGVTSFRHALQVDNLSGDSAVHASFHASFPSVEAIHAALASPEGQAAQADVPAFADGGLSIFIEHD